MRKVAIVQGAEFNIEELCNTKLCELQNHGYEILDISKPVFAPSVMIARDEKGNETEAFLVMVLITYNVKPGRVY